MHDRQAPDRRAEQQKELRNRAAQGAHHDQFLHHDEVITQANMQHQQIGQVQQVCDAWMVVTQS
jgi:hypothetical protein